MVARIEQNRRRSWATSRILRLRSGRRRPNAGCERKGFIYGQALILQNLRDGKERCVMTKMIGYCGLNCSDCPTFLATKDDDFKARENTAALYAEKFGVHLKPEDINCEGCRSEGKRVIGFCHVCAIRQCAMARAVEHCVNCADQPCEELSRFHSRSPGAKAGFDDLKRRSE